MENDDAINSFMSCYRAKQIAIRNKKFEEAVQFRELCLDLKESHPFLKYVDLGLQLGEGQNTLMIGGKVTVMFNNSLRG